MRVSRLGVLAIATALALGGGASAVPITTSAATAGLEGIPHYDHVVVLIEENESFASTFGPGSPATFLNGTLRPLATMDDTYYATGHVSLDNYITMTSGQSALQVLPNLDCGIGGIGVSLYICAQTVSTPTPRNLADQLEEKGLGWAEYADGTNKACVHDTYSTSNPATPDAYQGNGATPTNNGAGKDYADRHVPWLYYTNIIGNQARCDAHLLPFSKLATAIGNDTLPAFSFITPDTCHDGHDSPCAGSTVGGLQATDNWLKPTGAGNALALLQYLYTHNGLLILTFDEGAVSDLNGCCAGGPGGTAGKGGLVGLLAFGPGVASNKTIHTPYDHASLLRTVEDSFGISEHLSNAGSSTAMTDLFVASGANQVDPGTPAQSGGSGGRGLPNTSVGALPGPAGRPTPAVILLAGVAGLGLLPAAAAIRRRRR